MQNSSVRRSIGLLLTGIFIAISIAVMAPTPIALLLALVALPVEAYLVTAAAHGLSNPHLAPRSARSAR
jgi:hypothetical protein